MPEMGEWTLITYLQAGAYIAIMIAVFGGPQMISSYFEARNRRADRLEHEANAERRHQEILDAEARREERWREERREDEERRREERQQEEERRLEERRREDEERRREEERRRRETEAAERRHQELLAALIAAIGNGRNRGEDQNRLIETLRRNIEALEVENARLRRQNGNGNSPPPEHPANDG